MVIGPPSQFSIRLACLLEPFHVICETCGSRLKVRSEAVIGEIHACPKCDSMVQIVPPAGWSAIAAGQSISNLPSSAKTAAPVVGVTETHTPELVATDFAMPPAHAAPAAEPVLAAAAKSSSWLIWVAGGAAVLLVGGVVAAMWPRDAGLGGAPPNPPVIADWSTQTTDEIVPSEPPIVESTPASPETIAATTPTEPLSQALPEQPSEEPVAAATTEPPVAEPVDQTLPPPIVPSELAETEQPVDKESPRQPVMKIDPLDFDAAEFTLAPNSTTNAAPAAGSIPLGAETVDDAPANESDTQLVEAVEPAKVDRSLTFRLGPMLDGAPRAHGAIEQLSLRLKSFDVADMPLEQFANTLSDLTNVPITLEPAVLELAAISARQPIAAKAADATVEKLLQDALAKHRLGFVDNGGQLKLTLAGGDKRRAVDYDVADLVGSDDGKQLANLIQRFVAPESWQAGGGSIEVRGTKLHVDHTQNVRHQVLIFCERLRLSRGLPLRSRYPAALLSVESPYEQIAPKLKQKATFTFLPWSRLADVIGHWQDASDVTNLVDWAALADAELSPSSPIACSANDRSWQDILDEALKPIGLVWWPVNKDTIQITTVEALDDVQRIEFYAISKANREQFTDSEALLSSLQTELQEQDAKQAKQPVMSIDAASGRLIVLASPEVHRVLGGRLAQ